MSSAHYKCPACKHSVPVEAAIHARCGSRLTWKKNHNFLTRTMFAAVGFGVFGPLGAAAYVLPSGDYTITAYFPR